MKNILKFGALSLMLLLVVDCSAQKNKKNKKQKTVEEGHIVYTMSADGQMGAMMNGSKMEMFFSKNFGKMTMDMAGMMKMQVVIDNKSKSGLMLTDMMGKKKAAKITSKKLAEESQNTPKYDKVEYKKKFKKIAGYKCQEVHVTMEGIEGPAVVYVTTDFQPANLDKMSMQFKDLKGFPLSWKVTKMGMAITMEATEVSLKKQDKKTFSMKIPAGYEEVSMDELTGGQGSGVMGL